MTNKPKTTDELKIECAEYFDKIKAMKGCSWRLTWGLEIKEKRLATNFRGYHGPYLKIEDESPWSAVNILALLGYQVTWAYSYFDKCVSYFFGPRYQCGHGSIEILKTPIDQLVLAHNLAIMHLHKEDIKNGTNFVNKVLEGLG